MSTSQSNQPALRLVNAGVVPRATPLRSRNPTQAIAAENRSAATLSASDARWVLAARTASVLEGGRAAVLPPERRRRLVSLATNLGLRPFDANLVIAIVQDAARTGQGPLGPAVAERLLLVRPPERERVSGLGPAILASIGLAVILTYVLIGWILGG